MLVDSEMVVVVADITSVSRAERREVRQGEAALSVLSIRKAQAS